MHVKPSDGWIAGIPELGLPVLDPMVIDVMENEYEAGEVAGRFVLRDVHSYGLARTNFRAVRPYRDGNKMNFEIDVQIPKVFIEGNYKAEGAVGPYRIGGKGESPFDSLLHFQLFKTNKFNSREH